MCSQECFSTCSCGCIWCNNFLLLHILCWGTVFDPVVSHLFKKDTEGAATLTLLWLSFVAVTACRCSGLCEQDWNPWSNFLQIKMFRRTTPRTMMHKALANVWHLVLERWCLYNVFNSKFENTCAQIFFEKFQDLVVVCSPKMTAMENFEPERLSCIDCHFHVITSFNQFL